MERAKVRGFGVIILNTKAYYAERAKYHFEQYQRTVDSGDKEAQKKRHVAEYLNYEKASK